MSKFFDHKIKYRTLNQLLSSVADDMPSYDAENYIDGSQLIRVVRKINTQLGLRVTKTKEILVDFDNWVVNLPDDMETMNFAVLCGKYTLDSKLSLNIQTENVTIDCTGGCRDVFISPFGDTYIIVQKSTTLGASISFEILKRINIKHSEWQVKSDEITGVILGDNFMRMNIKSGRVYMNYEGILEDEDGNLLTVDHPLVNDYYEYSLKSRILENMLMEGEDTERKLALIEQRVRMSKIEAFNVVNTPEFKEIKEVIDFNREAMYKKYFSIFC